MRAVKNNKNFFWTNKEATRKQKFSSHFIIMKHKLCYITN